MTRIPASKHRSRSDGVPDIIAIAAVGSNGVIGADNDIPWRIREDWLRFKKITMGHVLIMGRKTYDSIGRPLPGRHTIVVTRDAGWAAEGVQVTSSVDAAIEVAVRDHPESQIFIGGGGEIYRLAWERLNRLEITEVDLAPQGSVTFPDISADEWRETERQPQDGFTFVSYTRR